MLDEHPNSVISMAVPVPLSQIIGRDDILEEIELSLFRQPSTLALESETLRQPKSNQQPRIVLTGEASVGKTAIASTLASRIAVERKQCSVFWIDASNIRSIGNDLSKISILAETDGLPVGSMRPLVYYLDWVFRGEWLMVLDNIDGYTLQHLVFNDWLPSGLGGRLLLTTRDSSCLRLLGQANEVEVKPLKDAELYASMSPSLRPLTRNQIDVAMISLSQVEFDAIHDLLDEVWDEGPIDLTDDRGVKGLWNAENSYCIGCIGGCNVVLARGPVLASVTASVGANFRGIQLVLLVGVCDGVPQIGEHNAQDIFRGDVVVSRDIFGCERPGKLRGDQHNFSSRLLRLSEHLRPLLAVVESDLGWRRLQKSTAFFMRQIQSRSALYGYPGLGDDKLFVPGRRHKHHVLRECVCKGCHDGLDPICDDAKNSACIDLGCENLETQSNLQSLIHRAGEREVNPCLRYGRIAAVDGGVDSGQQRDQIVQMDSSILALIADAVVNLKDLPCVAVKGVAGYGDFHNNKIWLRYAAATAASAAKALLVEFNRLPICWMVPFNMVMDFVGREDALKTVLDKIFPDSNERHCQLTALVGPEGVGKTQVAVEAARKLRQQCVNCSIYWISASPELSPESLENAFRAIGRRLKVPGIQEEQSDCISLVKQALSRDGADNWLFIIDDLRLESLSLLLASLPFSSNGSILLTCRNSEVAVRLGVRQDDIVIVPPRDTFQRSIPQSSPVLHEKVSENTADILAQEIFVGFKESTFPSGNDKRMLPAGSLESIIARKHVEDIMKNPSSIPGPHNTELVDFILGKAIKLFAIFLVIDLRGEELRSTIMFFFRNRIHDQDLPLDRQALGKLPCCENWLRVQRQSFLSDQWEFLAPLFLTENALERVQFEPKTIFPFKLSDRNPPQGGFGTVWKVKVHAPHLGHHQVSIDALSMFLMIQPQTCVISWHRL